VIHSKRNVADVAETWIELPSNMKTNQGYYDVYESACE
jgi:hypothetical protein